MKLIIVASSGHQLVAEVDDYTGPIPREGEHIFHPPLAPAENTPENAPLMSFTQVKWVAYGIIARPGNGERHFTGLDEPFVVVHV